MDTAKPTLPEHYRSTVRTVLRFSIAMIVVAILSGIFFQEAVRKMDYAQVPPGENLEAKIHLALVHGHIFTIAVFIPIAMAGALLMAYRIGCQELTSGKIKWLTHGYLTCTVFTVALQFYKGVHFVYSARSDASDFQEIDASLFAGSAVLRHGLYGFVHTTLAITLGVFLFFLWRSMKKRS